VVYPNILTVCLLNYTSV